MPLTLNEKNEEFERCLECNNPYFEEKKLLLIEKAKEKNYSINTSRKTLESKVIYICSECGTKLKKEGD